VIFGILAAKAAPREHPRDAAFAAF
jgi:hypothetical protein